MIILPLIIIALGSFCAGTFLIFKGYQQDADEVVKDLEPGVVPISDPKEIDDLKQNFISAQELRDEKSQSPEHSAVDAPADLLIHTEAPISPEDQRPTLASLHEGDSQELESEFRQKIDQLTYRLKEQEEDAKAKIFELTEDKRKLEDALRRELDSKENSSGSEDELAVKKELEERAARAESLIKSLTEENQNYNEQIQEQADEINLLKNEIKSIESEDKGGRVDPQELKIKEDKLLEAEGSVVRLMAENQRLQDQLNDQAQQIIRLQEEQKSAISRAEEDLAKVDPQRLKEAEEKVMDAQENIVRLTEENHQLNSQIQQQTDRINELNADINAVRSQSQEFEVKEKIKLDALQNELETQKQQIFEERQSDLATIVKLKNEKQALVDQENQYKNRISALELKIKEADSSYREELSKQKLAVKAEQESSLEQLKIQLAESQQKQAELTERSDSLKLNYEKRIIELNAEMDSLRSSLLKQESVVNEAAAESQANKEEIAWERERLFREVEELKAKCEKLEASNAHLQEKDKMLAYELSKSRAQALGLERICKDFKRQMEQGSV